MKFSYMSFNDPIPFLSLSPDQRIPSLCLIYIHPGIREEIDLITGEAFILDDTLPYQNYESSLS